MTDNTMDVSGQVAIVTGGGAWASSGWIRDRQGKWVLIEPPSGQERS